MTTSPVKKLGRPIKHNEQARDALIQAARHKFTKKPYDKVSIRELSDAAGVNSALIKYYFGNKQGLYKAMILEVTGQVMNNIKMHLAGNEFTSISDVFRSFTKVMASSPEFPLLMLKEVILNQGVCREFFLEQIGSSHLKVIDGVYSYFASKGLLKEGVDPVLFRISLMGLMIYPWYMRELMFKMEGIEYDESFLESLIQHNTMLMTSGLFNMDERH
ncbi:TetR/AcrR family transcriptional regulator [Pseudoalteromonas sp. S16_S37]|uniref:TetR/AcrR family transcriptional regulator n=1 Tax=Pseudoalteromonas sp. S16_S37 TaxID=2720228 RepID=UPI001680DD7E|nr:TetR/AcrR family transcriptional regulator [Pseudoalteromonas sp. S16_S37]MBD1582610.1 TetR/AcrR family transcriptional regulator [Pseudoalteromonas sp. S16_S37]